MQTTHWGIIGTVAIPIANAVISNICGHSVDLTTISWTSEITTIAVTLAALANEHFGVGQQNNSQPAPTPTPTPSGLTPDG